MEIKKEMLPTVSRYRAFIVVALLVVLASACLTLYFNQKSLDVAVVEDSGNVLAESNRPPPLSEEPYGYIVRDQNVYFRGWGDNTGTLVLVKNLNASSLKTMGGEIDSDGRSWFFFGLDAEDVYVGDQLSTVVQIVGADPSTFRVIGKNFAGDSENVYAIVELGGGLMFSPRVIKIEGADPESFTILGGGYAKDKNHIYFSGFYQYEPTVVEGADVDSFELTKGSEETDAQAKDATHTYNYGKRVEVLR